MAAVRSLKPLIFKLPTFCFGSAFWDLVTGIVFNLKKSTIWYQIRPMMGKIFLHFFMDQPFIDYRKFLKSGISQIWYQIVGLIKWNTKPETKIQKVDQKQNSGGLNIKGFKLLTAAILFRIGPFRPGLRYYILIINSYNLMSVSNYAYL
jgi:hypothetical protein